MHTGPETSPPTPTSGHIIGTWKEGVESGVFSLSSEFLYPLEGQDDVMERSGWLFVQMPTQPLAGVWLWASPTPLVHLNLIACEVSHYLSSLSLRLNPAGILCLISL